jgi:predicted polyphosphate/ATP-dependent NAD kinase
MLLGLIINPIAGMGGRVGLKGTDGVEVLKRAVALGAEPRSEDRARQALNRLRGLEVEWVTWGGSMGENTLKDVGLRYSVIGKSHKDETTREDTKQAAEAMMEKRVSLIVFSGGDGTAADIVEVVDKQVPIIGIPSGVKMYSAVFASTPITAADVIRSFVEGDASLSEREVMDIDEDAYRKGDLRATLKGYAMTPFKKMLVLNEKTGGGVTNEELIKRSIAERVIEEMTSGTLYIMGPGSTVMAINEMLGLEKSLLGVDLVRNKEIVELDVNEKTILDHLNGDARIIVSPLGGQGSLFGHGNQQISPKVIEQVGIDNIIILATPVKLNALMRLIVDTGDPELDDNLRGYRRVITGFHETRLVKVV